MKTDENNTTNAASENAEIRRKEKVKNDLEKDVARDEGMRKSVPRLMK